MDHSDGTAVAPGLLPSVDQYKPGVILLLKHPSVDRRYCLDHIEFVDQGLKRINKRASFSEQDLSKSSLDVAISQLQRYQKQALQYGIVQFIFTPLFVPRQFALMEQVESAFIYMPGYIGAQVVAAKINGEIITEPSIDHIQLLQRRKPKIEDEFYDANKAIKITVSGVAHSGRSAVSAVIMNALRDKWPHIHVDWKDPDNIQSLVQSNLADGQYENIYASAFLIVNENAQRAAKDNTEGQDHAI